MYPRNFWYAAAWDRDIGGKPFARTICDEKIVFYRRPDRSVVAMEDCCPHRLFPLSKGFVKGDRLVCGYHGLEFGEGGACVHMPNQPTIHPQAKVRAFPVVERHRFVWVWIGDPALADPALVPDLPGCDKAGWAFDGGTYEVKCDYRLLIDNLMDLTHETYVHASSIGQLDIPETPFQCRTEGNTVTLTRWMENVTPPPFWAHNLKSTEPVDRWQICIFNLPSTVLIDVGVAPVGTGAPQGDRSKGVSAWVIGLMTPRTANSVWYHWGLARDFEIDDAGLTARIKEGQGNIFREDEDVLEEQQRSLERYPDRRLVSFNIDAGGVAARRVIDRAIAASSAVQAAE